MIRLTRAQVRKVDELAVSQYGMPGILLMENAALAVVRVALQMAGEGQERVVMVCGGGNNGGDGFAVARHLHNASCDVRIVLACDPTRLAGDAKINYDIVRAMGLPMVTDLASAIEGADLMVDAMFGTGLTTPPRAAAQRLIREMNHSGIPILSIDVPSGLDCDTGLPLEESIIAQQTVTFVAEKTGFARAGAKKYTGHVTVGDIGCPRELISQVQS